MPLTIPAIDNRGFTELRDEGLGRIRVHNPEWTNLHRSDPGVTLVEVFAFLTESLLYRANLIPERNRRKFLKLLGVPLAPATAARGLVAFSNDRGPLETTTLPAGLEVTAGALSFRIDQGLDVLPVDARIYYKREVKKAPPEVLAYYNQLYASFLGGSLPTSPLLYQSVPLTGADGLDPGTDTIDNSWWVALVARKADVAGLTGKDLTDALNEIRRQIGSKTLTLGVVPWLTDATRQLTPGGTADPERAAHLTCTIQIVPEDGRLPENPGDRVPKYRQLSVIESGNVLISPGTVQVALPEKSALGVWTNMGPLEAGVGDFPPAIEDSAVEARVLTWLRFSVPPHANAKIRWTGINAATVSQRARVTAERMPPGTGAPEQLLRLSHHPVLPESVRVFVTRDGGQTDEWNRIDDLSNAGAEVPVPDPRLPPHIPRRQTDPRVFSCDAEAGELRFGDGARGARPPLGADIVVDYEYSEGREGNVNEGAIKSGPSLPPGFTVTNPVSTWGGADAETVAEGEKHVQRFVQHRERLVSAEDFAIITWRTPGVEMGRVEVIPASSPELGINEPGDAPGAVTLMLVPRHDPQQPDAPRPDRLFLDAVCTWLDPRRLVTTEVFLRGPVYKKIWVSVAIDVETERGIAEVRQAVEYALRSTLAPLPPEGVESGPDALLPLFTKPPSAGARGWPLRKSVVALELAAITARVPGVTAVRELLLAGETDTASQASIPMRGLELPRVAGIIVSLGTAVPIADLRGKKGAGSGPSSFLPIPVVPEEC
jgi:hypothetical protein